MKNWKVRVKLLMGFGIMAAFALAIGFVSLFLIRDMTTRASEIHEFISAVGSLDELKLNCEKLRADLFRLTLYSGDAAVADGIIGEAEGYIASVETALAEYAASAYDEVEEANFYSSKEIFETEFVPYVRRVHEAARQTGSEEAVLSAVESGEAIYAGLEAALDATIDQNIAWSWADLAATEDSGGTAILIQVGVMVLAFGAAVVFALYIASLICGPLGVITAFVNRAGTTGDVSLRSEDEKNIRKLAGVRDEIGQLTASLSQFVGRLTTVTEALKTVAEGDLSHEVELLSEQDLMGRSLETMVYSLNDIFSEVSQATEFVAGGSKQIADGAQNLAQASTEQATTVEDLSGKIAQVAKQTDDNAILAEQAARLAGTIMSNAEKGSRQMDDMMVAVNEIAEASQRISKVMKIIDDIAFQTNILALNASVEAARAGQHGTGFAVVAGEVRTLAVKSADAARDTGELIVSSIEKAELGSRLAGETAASLAEIVSGIGESNRIAGDIATSSKTQATDIEQIHRGVEQVAQVVQQNSATAEQSAAAAQEMNGQSETLKGLVARFSLKGTAPRVALPR